MLASAKCRALWVNENKQSIYFFLFSSDIVSSEISTAKPFFVLCVISTTCCICQSYLLLHYNTETHYLPFLTSVLFFIIIIFSRDQIPSLCHSFIIIIFKLMPGNIKSGDPVKNPFYFTAPVEIGDEEK